MATTPTFASGPNWTLAASSSVAGHFVLACAVLLIVGEQRLPDPIPVMVVELAQSSAPAASQPERVQTTDVAQPLPNMVAPTIDVPTVDAPLPPDPEVIPTAQPIVQHRPQPNTRPQPDIRPAQAAAAVRPATPMPNTARGGAGIGTADNAETRDAANEWYALVSAHLERNKRYPREARREGQQGTPSVRFSVDRRGRVRDVSIVTSSGHELLDEATLSLLQRVSPLPPMPRAMGRESVTITLPIEYSLSRK